MKLEIHAPPEATAGAAVQVRIALLNDSFEPVAVSRNALTGPDMVGVMAPPAVEATFGQPDEPLTLQPFTLYGRQREITFANAGETELTARYEPTNGEALTASKKVRVRQAP
jgi:hypothetical protein